MFPVRQLYERILTREIQMIRWPRAIKFEDHQRLSYSTQGMNQRWGIQAGYAYKWSEPETKWARDVLGPNYKPHISLILGFTEYNATTFVFVAHAEADNFGKADVEEAYVVDCMTMEFWKATVIGFISEHYYNFEDLADGYDLKINDLETLVQDKKPFWRKALHMILRQQERIKFVKNSRGHV